MFFFIPVWSMNERLRLAAAEIIGHTPFPRRVKEVFGFG